MTIEEKIKLAINKGITCNPETGDVFGVRGNILNGKSRGYMVIGVKDNNKTHTMKSHQFIWYWVYKRVVGCIDHINGIKDDNRISNLRSVTNQQNSFNTKAKGYSFDKRAKKWMSRIMVDGKDIYLGHFDSEDEARKSYLEAKKTYHII